MFGPSPGGGSPGSSTPRFHSSERTQSPDVVFSSSSRLYEVPIYSSPPPQRKAYSSPRQPTSRVFGEYGPESDGDFEEFFSEFKKTLWPENSRSPQMTSPPPMSHPKFQADGSPMQQGRNWGVLLPRTPPNDSRTWRYMGILPKPEQLPFPMMPEEQKEDMAKLGMDVVHLERKRRNLRAWFSTQLLQPLVQKIDTSHLEVMAAASPLGCQVSLQSLDAPGNLDPEDPTGIFGIPAQKSLSATLNGTPMDEDELLKNLKEFAENRLNALPSAAPAVGFGFNQAQQQTQQMQYDAYKVALKECLEKTVAHQRLRAILKGDRGNGILPFPQIPPAYTIQRIKELAKGYEVENFLWNGGGSYIPSSTHGQPIPPSPLSNIPSPFKPWSKKLPTDTHLLLHLFFCFLIHPKWKLHREIPIYPETKWTSTPVFFGSVPPSNVSPSKFISVISGAPTCLVSSLPPGALVVAMGSDMPPILALYWSQKPQFSILGINALWDTILIMLHYIQTDYNGMIQDVPLDSPTLDLLKIIS